MGRKPTTPAAQVGWNASQLKRDLGVLGSSDHRSNQDFQNMGVTANGRTRQTAALCHRVEQHSLAACTGPASGLMARLATGLYQRSLGDRNPSSAALADLAAQGAARAAAAAAAAAAEATAAKTAERRGAAQPAAASSVIDLTGEHRRGSQASLLVHAGLPCVQSLCVMLAGVEHLQVCAGSCLPCTFASSTLSAWHSRSSQASTSGHQLCKTGIDYHDWV